jgi:thioredoxin-like negative regulator of GroEL
MQARYLEQLGQAWVGRLSIQKVDADTEPEEAARYGVFTLPTTILVDEAGVVRQINYGLTHTSRLSQQVANL